jgi:hypothetical protein
MSGPIERIGFRKDEPAVTHPVLRAMVEAAAHQSSPRLTLDARKLNAAWIERREGRRRALGLAVAAGLGALALAGYFGREAAEPTPDRESVAVTTPERAAPDASDVREAPVVAPTPDLPPPAPVLAAAVRVQAEPTNTAVDYEVTGEWALSLREGGLRVELEEGASAPLEIALPDGALEIRSGVTIVEVAGMVAKVTVESGSAVRIEADGTRHELHPTHASVGGPRGDASRPGASELAALAEERLAAGDRAAAIKHLGTLVRRYPASAAARTGLIDLARLLKASGRNDEARCAYRLWLDRNPRAALRGEVERAVETLGEGPACRGLSPKR